MPGFADDLGKLTPHLRRFARALVRGHSSQTADDLVQETVVLASRADLPKRGPMLTTWCFAALIRLNRVRQRPSGVAPADGGGDGPLQFLPKELLRLDGLSLEHREVVLLIALAGLGYGQVADILNIDVEHVLTRLTHARDLLARGLGCESNGRMVTNQDRGRPPEGVRHLRLVK